MEKEDGSFAGKIRLLMNGKLLFYNLSALEILSDKRGGLLWDGLCIKGRQ
jgi:hypothetical protein